nr:MAG TPA: hypothetical protein [Caudoviricetes sp.]
MDIYISQPMEGREKAECDKELVDVAAALKREYKDKKLGFFSGSARTTEICECLIFSEMFFS